MSQEMLEVRLFSLSDIMLLNLITHFNLVLVNEIEDGRLIDIHEKD